MADANLRVNITDNAQKATGNLNAFTAAAQRAQRVVSDFSTGLVRGAREAWQEHQQATQNAIAPTKQFTEQIDKSNSVVTRFADTLTRRFILGVLISQLRHLGSAALAINEQFAALGETASRIGVSPSRLGGLANIAGAGGIDTSALLKDLTSFASLLDQSRHYATDLSNLFSANGIAIKRNADGTADLEANLSSVANLVRNASSEMDKFRILQQAGIDATQRNVRLFERGGDALREQMDQAARPEFDELVKKADEFDRAWNRAWTNFKQDAQGAFISASGFLSNLSDKGTAFLNALTTSGHGASFNLLREALSRPGAGTGADFSDFSRLDQFIASRSAGSKPTVNPQDQIKSLQHANQEIAILGNLATVSQLVTQKQNELQIARLSGVQISPQVQAAILAETRLQADSAIASSKVSFGLATERDIRTSLLAGIPPALRGIAEQTIAYQKLAEAQIKANQIAGASLPQLKQLELNAGDARVQLDQLAVGITNGIANPLVDMASGAITAGDAFKQMGANVVRAIANMVVQMTIAAPIARGLQSILGGFFGVPVPGITGSANGNIFDQSGIVPFANGGVVTRPTLFKFANGTGLMGEAGPEAIIPLQRGRDGKLGIKSPSGGQPIVQYITQDFRGVDPSMRAFIAAQIRASSIQTRQAAVVDVAKTRRDNPAYLSST